jgi:hypothetical protein
MTSQFEQIRVDIDRIASLVDFGSVPEDEMKLIAETGLPGAQRVRDADPEVARKAVRDLLQSLFGPKQTPGVS